MDSGLARRARPGMTASSYPNQDHHHDIPDCTARHQRAGLRPCENRPLGRGIQRFTGITQEMLADAPGLEEVLPPLGELLHDRVLVAHNAPFDRRVLRRGFELSTKSEWEWRVRGAQIVWGARCEAHLRQA